MLSTPVIKVAVDPIRVGLGDTVEKVRNKLKKDLPIFAVSTILREIYVVDRKALKKAEPKTKISKFVKKIKAISPDTQICEVARLMIEKGVDSYPVLNDTLKAISDNMILSAVKKTTELTKREVKTVMSPCRTVSESKLKIAEKVSMKTGLSVLPVVNESGKLIAIWSDGRLIKKPSLARMGTRVKLIIDKLIENPIVVIDKQRNPVGIVTKKDIFELAASFKEYTVPVFYSGLESLKKLDADFLKVQVIESIQKVNQVTPARYASVNVSKKGVWRVKVKLSTPSKMFMSHGENEEFNVSLSEALTRIVKEVMLEKKKRVKLRKITKE